MTSSRLTDNTVNRALTHGSIIFSDDTHQRTYNQAYGNRTKHSPFGEAVFAAFVGVAGITGIDIYKADVLACLFVGGMIPFIFSSLAIRAVGEAAMAMVEEVRRQFRTIPGIMEGTGKPEYDKCVAISTEASIKKMMLPGAITILSPLVIGFAMGQKCL